MNVIVRDPNRPKPIQADMAGEDISLIDIARLAGKNMLAVIPRETRRHRYLRGPKNIHWICDPEMIREILLGDGRRFPKAKFTRDIIGPAVGNGLILSEGERWKAQRHRYAPLFAARNLPVLTSHFSQTAMEMAESIKDRTDPVDIVQLAQRSTLTNITRVMFSGSDEVSADEVRAGLEAYFEHISHISLLDLMGMPKWLPRAKWLRGNKPVTSMRALAEKVLIARQAENRTEPKDFLDLMIQVLREDPEELEATIDNLLTFVVAGHETSANTIVWALYLLALHPDAQDRLRSEVQSVAPVGPLTHETLAKMPLLEAHVKETLRLYPAAAFFARDANVDLDIGEAKISKGDALFFPVYALHRHRTLWEDPERYHIDRFVGLKPDRGQYIPYGDGPRICIGAQYADAEIRLLVATLLRDLKFSLSADPIPKPVLTFTMRPEGPLTLFADPV